MKSGLLTRCGAAITCLAVAAASAASTSAQSRLQFGGYGEATFVTSLSSSDSSLSSAPYICLWLDYDFGQGWTMWSEVEFQHNCEVGLEQCWVQREFTPWLQLRGGRQVVPLGLTNSHHTPEKM